MNYTKARISVLLLYSQQGHRFRRLGTKELESRGPAVTASKGKPFFCSFRFHDKALMITWIWEGRTTSRHQEGNKLPSAAADAAKLRQLCRTLCDPIYSSPPGFPVPGILQARTLEWVAISFSNAWKWKVKVKSLSRVRLYRPHGLQPTRLLCPWGFPGKSTRVAAIAFSDVWS